MFGTSVALYTLRGPLVAHLEAELSRLLGKESLNGQKFSYQTIYVRECLKMQEF